MKNKWAEMSEKSIFRHGRPSKIQVSLQICLIKTFTRRIFTATYILNHNTVLWIEIYWGHYENTPIQIYWKFYNQKRKIFR